MVSFASFNAFLRVQLCKYLELLNALEGSCLMKLSPLTVQTKAENIVSPRG